MKITKKVLLISLIAAFSITAANATVNPNTVPGVIVENTELEITGARRLDTKANPFKAVLVTSDGQNIVLPSSIRRQRLSSGKIRDFATLTLPTIADQSSDLLRVTLEISGANVPEELPEQFVTLMVTQPDGFFGNNSNIETASTNENEISLGTESGIDTITGQTGEIGPVGPQGPQGPQGFSGPQGAQGLTGAQGPAGVGVSSAFLNGDFLIISLSNGSHINVGAVVGPQGPQGLTGAQGPKGENGAVGAIGAKGENGDDGVSVSLAELNGDDLIITLSNGAIFNVGSVVGADGAEGVQGPQGPQGLTGAQGPKGENGAIGAKGENGDDGISVSLAELNGDDLIIILSNGAVFNLGSVVGADGAEGIQGPQGPQGLTGAQGAQGPKGENGAVGAIGAKGENGEDGVSVSLAELNGDDLIITLSNGAVFNLGSVVGADGAEGVQGPQGLTGAQGPKGENGDDGVSVSLAELNGDDLIITLSNGAVFNLGSVVGADGAEGVQGPQGLTGAQGPKGENGAVGAIGAKGENGDDGVSVSLAELNGDDLIITLSNGAVFNLGSVVGADGAEGVQGPQGEQGLTGAQGAQGPKGENGDDGVSVSLAELNGDDLIITLSNGAIFNVGSVVGADGAEGVQGPQGPQGLTGAQGAQGPKGENGDDGVSVSLAELNGDDLIITLSNGAVFNLGSVVGADGAEGVQGPQGPQGLTGPQGPQGPQGLQGPAGSGSTGGTITGTVGGCPSLDNGSFMAHVAGIVSVKTNDNSEFTLSNIPDGSYIVEITQFGIEAGQSSTAVINNGNILDIGEITILDCG